MTGPDRQRDRDGRCSLVLAPRGARMSDGGSKPPQTNAHSPDGPAAQMAEPAQKDLSAPACHRVLKLARAVADLPGSENIQAKHLAEALQHRSKVAGNG